MSTDSFLDTLTITHSRTVVDTETMKHAIALLERVSEGITHAAHEYSLSTTLTSLTGLSYQCLSAAQSLKEELSTMHHACQELARKVGQAALIYLAAEGKSREFFALRAHLFPTPLSLFDAYVENEPMMEHVKPAILIPRTMLDFLPFATGHGSDPVDAQSAQLHLEALSGLLIQHIAAVKSASVPMSDGSARSISYQHDDGSWWQGDPRNTIQAASIMSAVFFAYGRLTYGHTTVAQGIGSVPTTGSGNVDVTLNVPTQQRAESMIFPLQSRSPLTAALFYGINATNWTILPPSRTGTINTRDMHRLSMPPQEPRLTTPPTRPSMAIKRIGNLAESQEYGQFEILKHETAHGNGGSTRSWSIIIRGTQHWDGGGSNPQDMLTNFQGVAGEESDQNRLIKAAMTSAGIRPNEAVEFVGHSQGGIVAAQLGADPEINEHYTVATILTAGAPTGGYSPHTSVAMLNLENTRDLVPSLEGRANADQGHSTTIYFDGNALGLEDDNHRPVFAHDISLYSEAMSRMENSDDPRAHEVAAWSERRSKLMGLTDRTRTTAYVFDTTRLHAVQD